MMLLKINFDIPTALLLILFFVMLTLKLFDVINCSWWIITLPVWFQIIITAVLCVVVVFSY